MPLIAHRRIDRHGTFNRPLHVFRLHCSSQRIIPLLLRVTGRTTRILTHWPSRRTANTWFLELMTATLPFGKATADLPRHLPLCFLPHIVMCVHGLVCRTPSDHSFKLVTFTHYQGVTALAFTKTGLATIGADNCLKTWELGAPEPAPAY